MGEALCITVLCWERREAKRENHRLYLTCVAHYLQVYLTCVALTIYKCISRAFNFQVYLALTCIGFNLVALVRVSH